MEAPRDTYKKEYRNITVRTTDGSTVTGKINIGIKERVHSLGGDVKIAGTPNEGTRLTVRIPIS